MGGTGDWKVARTRRQECLRYVAQAFLSAGSGDILVTSSENSGRTHSYSHPLDLLSPENARFFPLAPLVNLLEQCGLKMEYLWIALGSALGGAARYWLSGVVARRFGEAFPVGTLIVNITGSFAIGFIATLTDPGGR